MSRVGQCWRREGDSVNPWLVVGLDGRQRGFAVDYWRVVALDGSAEVLYVAETLFAGEPRYAWRRIS